MGASVLGAVPRSAGWGGAAEPVAHRNVLYVPTVARERLRTSLQSAKAIGLTAGSQETALLDVPSDPSVWVGHGLSMAA